MVRREKDTRTLVDPSLYLSQDLLHCVILLQLSPTELQSLYYLSRRWREIVGDDSFLRSYFCAPSTCNIHRHQIIVWTTRLNKRELYTELVGKIATYDPLISESAWVDRLSILYFAENGWNDPPTITNVRYCGIDHRPSKQRFNDLKDLGIVIKAGLLNVAEAAVLTFIPDFRPKTMECPIAYMGQLFNRLLTVEDLRMILLSKKQYLRELVEESIQAFIVNEQYDKIRTLFHCVPRSIRRHYYRSIYGYISPYGLKQLGTVVGRPATLYGIRNRSLFYQLLETKDRYNLSNYRLCLTPEETKDVMVQLLKEGNEKYCNWYKNDWEPGSGIADSWYYELKELMDRTCPRNDQ